MAAPKPSPNAVAAGDFGLRIAASEQGTTSTLEFAGEWDLAERDPSHAAIEQALERGPECVVFDLSAVDFIDSSGIHVVVFAVRRCREDNARIVIIPGPRHVHRVFEICQLTTQLPFASHA